jgi:hypothetical protein
MALWMMYVVPANGREDEITHMNGVKDQFTEYKISLDSLWINSPYGATYSLEGTTTSTSMNLGTGGGDTQVSGVFLPMLKPIASSATLSVQDGGDKLTITSLGPEDGGVAKSAEYNMSVLQYQSQNNYWLQQTYYYQDGGVFLTQLNGSVCRVSPPISFVNNTGTYSVVVYPVRLNGVASVGGNGPVRVDSRLKALAEPVQGSKYWVNTSVTVADYTTAQTWLALFNTTRRNGAINIYPCYTFGNSSPGTVPGRAFMNISGPAGNCALADTSSADVSLMVQPVEYDVTLNSIVSNLN